MLIWSSCLGHMATDIRPLQPYAVARLFYVRGTTGHATMQAKWARETSLPPSFQWTHPLGPTPWILTHVQCTYIYYTRLRKTTSSYHISPAVCHKSFNFITIEIIPWLGKIKSGIFFTINKPSYIKCSLSLQSFLARKWFSYVFVVRLPRNEEGKFKIIKSNRKNSWKDW
jgi:hypothetical protein